MFIDLSWSACRRVERGEKVEQGLGAMNSYIDDDKGRQMGDEGTIKRTNRSRSVGDTCRARSGELEEVIGRCCWWLSVRVVNDHR